MDGIGLIAPIARRQRAYGAPTALVRRARGSGSPSTSSTNDGGFSIGTTGNITHAIIAALGAAVAWRRRRLSDAPEWTTAPTAASDPFASTCGGEQPAQARRTAACACRHAAACVCEACARRVRRARIAARSDAGTEPRAPAEDEATMASLARALPWRESCHGEQGARRQRAERVRPRRTGGRGGEAQSASRPSATGATISQMPSAAWSKRDEVVRQDRAPALHERLQRRRELVIVARSASSA